MILDLGDPGGRYDRQELISWWDQVRLRSARVLVVGAGALGNELLKDLALVGVGHIEVIDLDVIERSNLARCVLFRTTDEGQPKAIVAARVVAEMNPEISIVPHVGNVTALPLGWIARFDVVIGGLDNREARVWINQACRKLGLPWVDGAIEGLRGVARTFMGDGPCYECTLSEADREILSRRRSCALLTTEEIVTGKVPTTATTASLIAAVQIQEVIRILHGEATLRNQGWTFIGETLDAWLTEYSEDPYCLAHDRYGDLVPTTVAPGATLSEVLERASDLLDQPVVAIDLECDVVLTARCGTCGWMVAPMRRAVDLQPDDVRCPTCSEVGALEIGSSFDPSSTVLDRSPWELGLPPDDVVTIRGASARVHLRLEVA